DDDIARDADPAGVEEPAARIDHLGLHERVADGMALREQEREHHRPTHEDRVAALQERVDHAEFVADLRAAQYGHERTLPRMQKPRERLDLTEQQPATRGRKDARRTD